MAAFWAPTQAALGPLVPAPALTDKLLQKPPFRFIHEIIMTLLAQYGFAKGLIREEEYDAKAFEDKERKIAFLERVIFLVNRLLGVTLAVRASKITSGSEPENTNEFL
eukprot:EG_transcript_49801